MCRVELGSCSLTLAFQHVRPMPPRDPRKDRSSAIEQVKLVRSCPALGAKWTSQRTAAIRSSWNFSSHLSIIQQPPQIADQRQRFGRLGRASAMLPSIAIAQGCAGASPAVHPAPFPPLHGWRLAFRTGAGPGQTARGLPQRVALHGVVRQFRHFL